MPASSAARGSRTGDFRATAAEARYQIVAGTLALSGKEGTALPRVTDPTITVDADAIVVGLANTAMKANGSVQSVLQPARGADDKSRTPALLEADQPVYVTAQRSTTTATPSAVPTRARRGCGRARRRSRPTASCSTSRSQNN